MIRFLAMGLMALAMAFPAGAAMTDDELFAELLSREWVTLDANGVPNHLVFSAISEQDRLGLAVREFAVPSGVGRTLQSIPMMFWVEGGIITIAGNHYFIMGADGFVWRIDRDTQTIEPAPP